MTNLNHHPEELQRFTITLLATVKDAVEAIDKTGAEIVLVCSGSKLNGVVTDSDVRRGILRGIKMDDSVKEILNVNFHFASEQDPRESVIHRMIQENIRQMPVLNPMGEVIDLILLKQVMQQAQKVHTTPVLIMAGGLGTRLRPLTAQTPKPMMSIGGKPIMEILIEHLKQEGFRDIYVAVNYRKETIKTFFEHGEAYGVNLHYIEEPERLGTAGAIRLAIEQLTKPFLVINGDILTKANFSQFLKFHRKVQAALTIASVPYDISIPYGVIEVNQHRVTGLTEKPRIQTLINAGIYCVEPQLISFIPENQYFDMTHLIGRLLEQKVPVSSYPLHEYWLDIGKHLDYKKANNDYKTLFNTP
ncbi:nucleotidyltransferase family protein [Paenibacillus rigui]|nr:nucleotidyltransferase family protein [Paenibacillus rigui]